MIAALLHRLRHAAIPALAFVLCAVVATPATAATFPDLYTVSVAPAPAAQNARTDAIRRAMGILLTRITGRRDPAAYPEMEALLRGANDYVASYTPTGDRIRVGFSRTEVDAALTRQNLPYWGAERPATLLWLAFDMGGDEYVELMANPNTAAGAAAGLTAAPGLPSFPLGPEASRRFDLLVRELLAAADERGLPVVLPRLDEADRIAARFADVWGGFDPFVARAAEPYGVDAVLIGRVSVAGDRAAFVGPVAPDAPDASPAPGVAPPVQGVTTAPGSNPPGLTGAPDSNLDFAVEVRWTLLRGNQRETRITNDIRGGIDWLADQFAAQFVTFGGARLTWITVHGIGEFRDYGRVNDYLNSVSLIESADATLMREDGSVLFEVTARGDDAALRQILTLDGQLVAAGDRADGVGIGAVDGAGIPPVAGNGAAGNPATGLEFIPAWLVEPAAPGQR